MSNRKRSQTWSIKKSSDSHDSQELQKDLFEKSNENNDLQKDLTYTKSHVTMNRNIEKERKMTVQINKVFNSIDDGINNMLDAVVPMTIQRKFTHTSSDDFRDKFIVKVGKKYIKIGRKSNYNDKMGQVWAFVVNTDDDKLFQRGDVLKVCRMECSCP